MAHSPIAGDLTDLSLQTLYDATANQNAKQKAPGTGRQWKILWVYVAYTSDANAGNREIQLALQTSGTSEIFLAKALNVQIASQTEKYIWLPGLLEPAETVAGIHWLPLPRECWIPANYILRVEDIAAISATDDMILFIAYQEVDL